MRYLVTSDVHLGHPSTPTEHIIESFKQTILNEKHQDLDILFIAGDLFDRLLDLSSREVHVIIGFFNYLLSYCTDNDIKLRVLLGTPSHDWKQSELLVKLNDIRVNKCDLIYHKQLDIEYIPSLNKHVLYIPDEWFNKGDDVNKQIQAKLMEHNITQVDIAILHGQFNYQVVGKKYEGFAYDEDYFLQLVRGFIHIGHYHTFSSHDRIIANGSLERLVHGEEEEKGCVIVNDNSYTFLPNVNSYTYKTIQVTMATTVERLDKQIMKLPRNSHVRLLMSKDHPFNLTYPELKLRYMDYNLKKKLKDATSEDLAVTYIVHDDDNIDFGERFILENNIHQTLLDIVKSKYSLNSVEEAKLLNYASIFKEN